MGVLFEVAVRAGIVLLLVFTLFVSDSAWWTVLGMLALLYVIFANRL